MKNLMNLFLLSLVTAIFVGCASQQRSLNVGSDQRTDADFSDFQTYNWMSDNEEDTNNQFSQRADGDLIYNNQSTRSNIKGAIETQLEARGFRQDSNNPDMLVNYSVLEQADQLRTYTRDNYSYLGTGPAGQNVEMVNVEPGTVLVNFIDAESGLQVWQGFASGALQESDVQDDKNLQAKIGAIFEEFDFSTFSVNSAQGPR